MMKLEQNGNELNFKYKEKIYVLSSLKDKALILSENGKAVLTLLNACSVERIIEILMNEDGYLYSYSPCEKGQIRVPPKKVNRELLEKTLAFALSQRDAEIAFKDAYEGMLKMFEAKTIRATRESVCMGDDVNAPNAQELIYFPDTTLSQFLKMVEQYVPSMKNALWRVKCGNIELADIHFDKEGKTAYTLKVADTKVSALTDKEIYCTYICGAYAKENNG